MIININVDTKDLSEVQRNGLALLLEAGNQLGELIVSNTDEAAKEPLKEEPAPAPKRRTRKKAEAKPETPTEEPGVIETALTDALDEGAAEEAKNVAAAEKRIEEASEPASTEELEAEAISVASPVIRKGPEAKAKVRTVLETLGVERITELSGNREGLETFIRSVRAIAEEA